MSDFNKASALAQELGRPAILKKIKQECKRLKKHGGKNAKVATLVLEVVDAMEGDGAEESAKSLLDMDTSSQKEGS
tara:strand:- start:2602 stop:2829 length:228 start_codon:yes stop_codon:yes gene_type:complete